MRIALGITGLVLFLVGMALICIFADWRVALGIWLLMWSDNISKHVSK